MASENSSNQIATDLNNIASHLSSDSPLLEYLRIPDYAKIIARHPTLAIAAREEDSAQRIIDQDNLEECLRDPSIEPQVGTYGKNAPTYRFAIDYLLSRSQQLKDPSILILGTETPGAVQQVISFTKKYKPRSIIVGDISADSLEFCRVLQLPVMTYLCDFLDSGSMRNIPLLNFALGDQIVGYLLDGSKNEEYNIQVFYQFVSNIGEHLSSEGAIILTCDSDLYDVERFIFNKTKKINNLLANISMKIIQTGLTQHFEKQQPFEYLESDSYDEALYYHGTGQRQKYVIIKKTN